METIVDSLCSNMLSDNEQLRDISSIGKQLRIRRLNSSELDAGH